MRDRAGCSAGDVTAASQNEWLGQWKLVSALLELAPIFNGAFRVPTFGANRND